MSSLQVVCGWITMLSYNKVCEVEDFANPELRAVVIEVFAHERSRFGKDFPTGREYRKYWEVGMAVRTLADCGILRPEAEVLGIGAGNEPTVFYLTKFVRRVFATDLYLGHKWQESASPGMMVHPERYWPAKWNARRLVVQHMNALDLKYEDGCFDGIFSSSSIEHFGTPADVRRSLSEMARVLKPNGVLSLSTEFRLQGNGLGLPGVLMFDEGQILDWMVRDNGWVLVSPPQFDVSNATRATEISFASAIRDYKSHVASHGEMIFHDLTWSRYPHIVLRQGEYLWTSVHVALRKRP